MANKNDAEFYINKVVALLKSSFNGELERINAIKDDGITLRQLSNDAYHYLTFGQKTPAYDPCIILAVDTDQTGDIGRASETLRITLEIVSSDRAQADSLKLMKELQRYRQALFNLFIDNYKQFPALQIVGLPDVAFATRDGGLYYAIGIGLEMNYTL